MKHNWLFWLPRAIIVLFALFTMLFSLDVLEMQLPWYKIALGLLIHNIPFFALVIVLWLSWRHPAISSIICFLVMLGFAFIMRGNGTFYVHLIFGVPLFIAGTMFLLEHLRVRKEPAM